MVGVPVWCWCWCGGGGGGGGEGGSVGLAASAQSYYQWIAGMGEIAHEGIECAICRRGWRARVMHFRCAPQARDPGTVAVRRADAAVPGLAQALVRRVVDLCGRARRPRRAGDA